MAMEMIYNRFMTAASTWYKKALAKELNKIGVRYEDLIISEVGPFKEAVELTDPDIVKGRNRRIKRAMDLTFKGKLLQDYAPDMKLYPFKEEIYPLAQKIQARENEIALLDLHKK